MSQVASRKRNLAADISMDEQSDFRDYVTMPWSYYCSCKDKFQCPVLAFFEALRLNPKEMESMISRTSWSKTIEDTSSSSSSQKSECGLFTLLKGLELNCCDNVVPTRKPPTKWQELKIAYNPMLASMKVLHDVHLSRCTRVSVEGYNTLLPPLLVRSALEKHFRRCGEIFAVVIPSDHFAITDRCGVIYFSEEGAKDKALALNGTEVPGDNKCDVEAWNVIVKPLPNKLCGYSLDQVAAALRDQHFLHLGYHTAFSVSGYDTGLPMDDVKSQLFKLFSSCGEITCLDIYKGFDSNCLQSSAFIHIWGEDAMEKAKALNGSDMGGWNVVVEVPLPYEARPRRKRNTKVGWSGPPLNRRKNLRGWDVFCRAPLPARSFEDADH